MSLTREHSPGSLREVVHIAWPIVVGMLSYTAMGVADTLLVGALGTTELAAVGLATTVFFLVNSFFLGSIHGVKVVAAQATGAGRHDDASQAAWHGIALAIPFGLLVVALAGFDGLIFRLMGAPDAVRFVAPDYFDVRVLAAPLWYVTIAITDYYQGTGDTKTPMKLNLVVNAVNIVLDVLLIHGYGPFPALGVAGAAWATVIACGIGMVTMAYLLVGKLGWSARPNRAVFGQITRLGLPIGVRYLADVAGWTVFTAILARQGEAELAAHVIAIKILSVSFLPGYGMSETATVLVGQYVGAEKPEAARRSFHNALWIALAVMGGMAVIFFTFPHALVGLFRNDPEVLAIGSTLLMIAAVFQVFDAVAMVATGALNGAGDTRFTMLSSLIGVWTINLPAAWFFAVHQGMGAAGAWIGLTLEIVFLSGVLLWRFRARFSAGQLVPVPAIA